MGCNIMHCRMQFIMEVHAKHLVNRNKITPTDNSFFQNGKKRFRPFIDCVDNQYLRPVCEHVQTRKAFGYGNTPDFQMVRMYRMTGTLSYDQSQTGQNHTARRTADRSKKMIISHDRKITLHDQPQTELRI